MVCFLVIIIIMTTVFSLDAKSPSNTKFLVWLWCHIILVHDNLCLLGGYNSSSAYSFTRSSTCIIIIKIIAFGHFFKPIPILYWLCLWVKGLIRCTFWSWYQDAPLWTPSGQFSPHIITNTPSPVVSPRQEAYAMRQQAMSYSAGNTTPQDKANKVQWL